MNKEIKNVVKDIINVLIKKYSPEKIVLFGSYAYGNYTRDSDIDLLIIKDIDKKNRIDRFIEVKKIIYNPKLKIPVSPLVLTKDELQQRLNMGDDFIKGIITDGEVLYER